MTEIIKIMLIKRKMTIKELSEKINIAPNNLSNKFKRDNFSVNELREIATALNCELKIEFVPIES